MINWINRQSEFSVAQFEKSMETYYPRTLKYFTDYREFYKGLTEVWNYLEAVKRVDWDKYLDNVSEILDIGGGVGWLTAYLSKFETVDKVYILDSSRYFLNDMLPGMVRLMEGEMKKIVPIEGLFSPILFGDDYLDMIVVSSSLHHADNLEFVLKEANRVLKRGGLLLILNETPPPDFRYIIWMIRIFIVTMKNTILRRYNPVSQSISSSGLLYDPRLGDRVYPFWFWRKALNNSNFEMIECIKTGLLTVKTQKRGWGLTHFICRKR